MSKGETIGNLLKVATPVQLARVRAYLETVESTWATEYTPQEYALACSALQAFDEKNYSDPNIARYMGPKIIEKIFG
jgi:hypothetical protein